MAPHMTPHGDRAFIRRPYARRKLAIPAVASLLTILVWGKCSRTPSFLPFAPEPLPDFSHYTDIEAKKSAFFDFLAPQIETVNRTILEERTRLLGLRDALAAGDRPGWLDRRWIARTAEHYALEVPEDIDLAFLDLMLRRVDIIAPSLIMAQAANESAWGTSRFARQGNNLFGMRSYEPGTGIVPKRRASGATWEVAAYDSVRESIEAYIQTLNTVSSYQHLRSIRRDLRRKDQVISGLTLAGGLTSYSERGSAYIAIIRSIIRSNQLFDYDEAHMEAEKQLGR